MTASDAIGGGPLRTLQKILSEKLRKVWEQRDYHPEGVKTKRHIADFQERNGWLGSSTVPFTYWLKQTRIAKSLNVEIIKTK